MTYSAFLINKWITSFNVFNLDVGYATKIGIWWTPNVFFNLQLHESLNRFFNSNVFNENVFNMTGATMFQADYGCTTIKVKYINIAINYGIKIFGAISAQSEGGAGQLSPYHRSFDDAIAGIV